VPEDATAALTPELQQASMNSLGHAYAKVKSTEEWIRQIESAL
jgi:hypothetical protein